MGSKKIIEKAMSMSVEQRAAIIDEVLKILIQ